MDTFDLRRYFKERYLEDSTSDKPSNMLEENLRSKVREIILSKLSENYSDLEEAKKDEEPTEDIPEDETPIEDIEGDFPGEGEGEINVSQDAEANLSGTKGNVQDNLEAALKAAQDLGDQKLIDQIGNTITFFTRAHVIDANK